MALNVWSSMTRNELSHLLRLGVTTRCCTSRRNFNLACLNSNDVLRRNLPINKKAEGYRSSVNDLVSPSRIDRFHMHSTVDSKCIVRSPSTVHLQTSCQRNLQNGGEKSRQILHTQLCEVPGIVTKTSFGASRMTFSLSHCVIRNLHCTQQQQVRCLHVSRGLWAGHNKWSKVRHIKGPKDQLRSIQISKIALQMKIAIRDGGANPDLNSALGSLISKAKTIPMPKASIEAVIKNASKKGGSDDADTQILLEARGPGQFCLLVDVLTDNPRRSRLEIQKLLHKNGGDFGTSMYAFQRKGVVRVLPQSEGQETPLTLDLATEVAIEVGAEDVQETTSEDDIPLFMFICDIGDLHIVRTSLASLNYTVESSSLEYLPETTTTLNDANLERAFDLVSLLNDHANVIKVYDNIKDSG